MITIHFVTVYTINHGHAPLTTSWKKTRRKMFVLQRNNSKTDSNR